MMLILQCLTFIDDIDISSYFLTFNFIATVRTTPARDQQFNAILSTKLSCCHLLRGHSLSLLEIEHLAYC